MQSTKGNQFIPIEALWEYNVQEIGLNGVEILEKPLTAADNFQRIVNAIDFNETDDDVNDKNAIQSFEKINSVSEKMWSDLKAHLINSLTEVCALVDLLAVLKETKYLSIFPIKQKESEINFSLFLAGKKMALATASETFLKNSERLRCRFTEKKDYFHNSNYDLVNFRSYHESLMNLRKSWRLKIFQNSVLGDVSLRSIGSKFKEKGNFEVIESDNIANINSISEEFTNIRFSSNLESIIKYTNCSGRLSVVLQDSVKDKKSVVERILNPNEINQNLFNKTKKPPRNQFEQLCLAQSILACREIMSILTYEASISKASGLFEGIVAFATENEVICTIFPGVQMLITFDCSSNKPTESNSVTLCNSSQNVPHDMNNCLSIQLRRLLHHQHITSWTNMSSLPVPATGTVQVPQRLRCAGALALYVDNFVSNSLLNVQPDDSLPIATASVAGFAVSAASAWMNSNFESGQSSGSNQKSGIMFSQPHLANIGYDRHAYYNEWGSATQLSTTSNNVSTSSDNFIPSSANISTFEHSLNLANASDCAIESIIGSSEGLFGRFITISRHYYLRYKVSECLREFSKTSPVSVVTHWNVINSAVESSAFIIFKSRNYCLFRCRLGLTVCSNDIKVHIVNPSQIISIGTSINRLWEILRYQAVSSQLGTLNCLAGQLLGWTRLGSISIPSTKKDDQALNDDLETVNLYASPKGDRMACVRSSSFSGLRLFLAKSSAKCLSDLATDSKQMQLLLDNITSNSPEQGSFVWKKIQKDDYESQTFREVNLDKIPGLHAVAKIEMILTCLS